MNILTKWILYAISISFIAWLIPGISISNFLTSAFVVILLALVNTFIKPILIIATLPVNILTLGMFTIVINTLLLWFVSYISPGFEIENFLSALLGSIILSLLSIFINTI